MARGFESKDVEYQQAEAQRQKSGVRSLTPADKQRLERRRTLELSLSRAEGDLAAARSPVHRQMLEQAVAVLRQRLERE